MTQAKRLPPNSRERHDEQRVTESAGLTVSFQFVRQMLGLQRFAKMFASAINAGIDSTLDRSHKCLHAL